MEEDPEALRVLRIALGLVMGKSPDDAVVRETARAALALALDEGQVIARGYGSVELPFHNHHFTEPRFTWVGRSRPPKSAI